MRTFIAFDICSKVLKRVSRLQDEIRRSSGGDKRDVKWVETELMHLTLKFLGEIDDSKVVEVCRAVEETAGQFGEFEAEVKNVGSFGRPPRVVWIGVDGGAKLVQFQKNLDEKLAEIGFSLDEKPFVGHLTLCRFKKFGFGKRIGRIIEEYSDFSAGKFQIDSVSVYKSELTNAGPEYTLLGKFKL